MIVATNHAGNSRHVKLNQPLAQCVPATREPIHSSRLGRGRSRGRHPPDGSFEGLSQARLLKRGYSAIAPASGRAVAILLFIVAGVAISS